MKAAFVINNLNKGAFVYRCVKGALAQTYPCEVIIADAQSTDNSMAEIERAIKECPRGAEHIVRVLISPKGENNFQSFSDNFMWTVQRTDADWIVHCSSDDYSLPDRTKVCMEAVAKHKCSIVANTMYFAKAPGDLIESQARSGFPQQTGYVPAGEGLMRLAFGSVIAAFRNDFLLKTGPFNRSTPDVFYGFLAAIDDGFYAVCDPQHVHVQHESVENLGFQGKLLAATGDESLVLNELNQLQLMALYFHCAQRANELHPAGIPVEAANACAQMILNHAGGLLHTRMELNAKGLQPGILR